LPRKVKQRQQRNSLEKMMTEKIDEVLQAAVARGDVPGVVALAAGDDGVLYEGAAGRRAADAGDPIAPTPCCGSRR
jgi:methyl acetate hydrolase